jgi:hypothetical protein
MLVSVTSKPIGGVEPPLYRYRQKVLQLSGSNRYRDIVVPAGTSVRLGEKTRRLAVRTARPPPLRDVSVHQTTNVETVNRSSSSLASRVMLCFFRSTSSQSPVPCSILASRVQIDCRYVGSIQCTASAETSVLKPIVQSSVYDRS